jgi:hypothetical protein
VIWLLDVKLDLHLIPADRACLARGKPRRFASVASTGKLQGKLQILTRILSAGHRYARALLFPPRIVSVDAASRHEEDLEEP